MLRWETISPISRVKDVLLIEPIGDRFTRQNASISVTGATAIVFILARAFEAVMRCLRLRPISSQSTSKQSGFYREVQTAAVFSSFFRYLTRRNAGFYCWTIR